MGNAEQITVYHSKYDDGSRGYAVRLSQATGNEWKLCQYCTRKAEFNRPIRTLKSKYKPLRVVKKKC